MSDYNIDNAKNDIEKLQEQNSYDFQEIKRLDGLIKDYDKRVLQAINMNNQINKRIQDDYEEFKKTVMDDNLLPGNGGNSESIRIIDNLNSTSTTSGLSANQGRILKSSLDSITTRIDNLDLGNNGGEGLTSTQKQQLQTAYEHSQKVHLQSSDIPTKTSQLTNDCGYLKSTDVSITISNPYKNTIWNCLGDSITAINTISPVKYYDVVNEVLEFAKINNYGVSGTTIAKKDSSDNTAMCIRCTSMDKNASVVSVVGGVNDCGNNITMGDMSSSDLTTFYGALKYLCEYLLNNFSGKTIFFCTPTDYSSFFDNPNAQGLSTIDYADAMKEVCGYYGIDVIDFRRKLNIQPSIYTNSRYYTTDGLHWNGTGHTRAGNFITNYLLFEAGNLCLLNNGEGTDIETPTLTTIEASYNQGFTVVHPSTSLDSLKTNLVVKANYDNGSQNTLSSSDYSLSGNLSVGTSTITVSYLGKTTTFIVTVIEDTKTLSSISVTYNQGSSKVYPSTVLNSLKNNLVVKANYSDSSQVTLGLNDYSLSGTLREGTSTITVTYNGKTTTFTVNVASEPKTYTITNTLANATNSNSTTTIIENSNYSARISANDGYSLNTVTVTMGGSDVTELSYSDGVISISKVTGNIVIIATTVKVEVDVSNEYVGKTITVTGINNGESGFHLLPLVENKDYKNGTSVRFEFEATDIVNLQSSTLASNVFLFGGNYDKSNNNVGVGKPLTQTVDGTNMTITSDARTLSKDLSYTYLKPCIKIVGTPTFSFKISKLKIYVNDTEVKVVGLESFYPTETFTIN